MINTKYKWWHILLGIMSLPLGMMIAGIISVPTTGALAGVNTGAISNMLQFIIAIIFAFVVLKLSSKISSEDFGIYRKNFKRIIFISIILGLVYYFISELSEQFFPELKKASEQVTQSLNIGKNFFNDVLLVLNIALFAPIVEELIFRGILFQSVASKLSGIKKIPKILTLIIAITISAFAFASSHGGGGQDAQTFFFIFLSIITAIAFYKTKNILSAIFIHGINNVVVFIMIIHGTIGLSSQHGLLLAIMSVACLFLYAPLTKLFTKILPRY